MANYTTNLKDWGETGTEYPNGYSYTEDVPPVDVYDDFLAHNTIEDVQHLVSLTNNRIEADKGVSGGEPASPETSHVYHDQDNERLEVWDAGASSWYTHLRRDGDTMAGALDMGGYKVHDDTGTLTLGGTVNAPGTLNYGGNEVATQTWANGQFADSTHNHDSLYDDYNSWTIEEGDGEQTDVYSGQKLEIYGGTDLNTEVTSTGAETRLQVNHSKTSSQGDVSSNGATVIDDIGLDSRGHVTNLNTENRSLDNWNSANNDVGFGDNRAVNLKAVTFNNSEHSNLENSGLGWDNSEGGSAFSGGLIFKDTNGKSGHLVTADTDMSVPGYLDNRAGDRIGVPTYTSTSDLPSGNAGDIAYVSNDNALYVYN